MDIFGGKRKDAEMNDLISIGTCGLLTIHHVSQHGEEASKWHIKKFLAAIFNIIHEFPSRRADLKNVTGYGENWLRTPILYTLLGRELSFGKESSSGMTKISWGC